MSASIRLLLASFPPERSEQTRWFREIARSDEVAVELELLRLFGADVTTIDEWFPCVHHGDACLARLTRASRNGEIVYQDSGLAAVRREFQTIPELAALLRTRVPTRLNKFDHVLWRLRLLQGARLIELPHVVVPTAPETFPEFVSVARDGFERLFRCRALPRP